MRPELRTLVAVLASALVWSCSGDDGSSDGGGGTAGGGTGGGGGAPAAAANLIENGDFADGRNAWIAVNAVLSAEDGTLRVETEAAAGPGLAYQIVDVTPGHRYKLSARLLDATYARSNHVRAGLGINLDEFGSVWVDEPEITFTATSSAVHVTCNNVAAAAGEFALFDDVVLVEVDQAGDGG